MEYIRTDTWWRHQMETFSALLALCEGNYRSPVDSLIKASDADLCCFLWCSPEQTTEQTFQMPVIWDAMPLIVTSLQWVTAICFTSVNNMMTSSNGNIFRVTGHLCGEFTGPGEFPTQRPVTRNLDVFFDLRPNKLLSKQSWGWWFETQPHPLWRHRNEI